jgi:carbon-monoxide dehydrogenase medium subunit
MNLRLVRPSTLIDINRIAELDYIHEEDDTIAIGALTRHNAVRASPVIARYCPLVTEAYGLIANKTVRNRGTIGGNICHADPASENPAVLLAMDATLVIRNANSERRARAQNFFHGIFQTAVASDEMLTEIRIPKRIDREGWAILEVSPRKGDFALVVIAASLVAEGSACRQLRLSAAGIEDKARRILPAEQSLQGREVVESALELAASVARDSVHPNSDHHADSAYRRDLVYTLSKRAMAKAFARAIAGE